MLAPVPAAEQTRGGRSMQDMRMQGSQSRLPRCQGKDGKWRDRSKAGNDNWCDSPGTEARDA